ncbi:Succinate--hydroxymethylglutarate CoA-transferase [Wickerhamiella sorbophila]|uniref:Succinate--hydroxymethylglutarate CoA-transferase n=1 Tax=Wickerhamiella sorbophila TaxID=45607 RepID=A0A2T0FJ97_9ASCO|nr:Succinate--hydroxymethylglutarate CoA-transferase [Wickerhamiella sorbophila]PRT55068.1 Succinate--hydroxymethylglutarate CoA-transferase [Wickerhamiella sorbophila]
MISQRLRAVPIFRRYASTSKLPLSNIRVVDLTRVLAGPYCSQILGDLGADVLKIEHPVRGDDTRAWGPPFSNGESAYYLSSNRNKRSLAVDFKQPEGQEIIKQLVAESDVLLENFLPGGLEKYGLGYKQLQKINPNLVYASITGYGQTGPWAKRPGYDVMVEAEFGLMHITGEPDGQPVKVGVAVTDLMTGMYTTIAVMGALKHVADGGKGQHLDCALADVQLANLANIASSVLVSGKPDSGRQGTAHPSICPYEAFETKDGSIMIGGGNDNLFRHVCDALGKPEWKNDERFITNSARVQNRHILVSAMNELTRSKTTKEWESEWQGKPFPYAPINDVKASLEHPQAQARNMVVEVDHPLCGALKLVNSPIKWSETQPEIRMAPPTLGQHTDEILNEFGLGDKIASLREKKVIS